MNIAIQNGVLQSISETIYPSFGYRLPDALIVTGATHNYNNITGALTLSDISENVSINAQGKEQSNMNATTIGTPNKIVKGIANVIITDPTTGNIVAYDNVASEGATSTSVSLNEIAGGAGNGVIAIIPDTTRVTGTLTSQAFSLEERALATGGELAYGGIVRVCETITSAGGTLTITGNPTKAYEQSADDVYGWCYVSESGASSYIGTNYNVDLTTKTVVDFVAEAGKTYVVQYFAEMVSAQALELPKNFKPKVVSVDVKYGVYTPTSNNSVSDSTYWGDLHVIVPRAMLTGDAGVSASQTTNATTPYNWTAIEPESSPISCGACGQNGGALAYYVLVPCEGATSAVEALAIVGGGVSVEVGESAKVNVKYVMPDGSVQQPDYTDLSFESGAVGTATVSDAGVVTGVAVGDTVVTVSLEKENGTTITATAAVEVTEASA